MEKNYKVYNLDGEFLEYTETRMATSYGKPGLNASHAKKLGLSCYATRVPGSPADLKACKEAYARFGHNSNNAVWCVMFSVWGCKHNVILVKDESKVHEKIKLLLNRFGDELDEMDISVSLCAVE